jgi:hypothetical protein
MVRLGSHEYRIPAQSRFADTLESPTSTVVSQPSDIDVILVGLFVCLIQLGCSIFIDAPRLLRRAFVFWIAAWL